jgi:selenocysteine-specific elongation factor
MPSLHLLIGTAGHVDHGKTRLVEALTGIDCDRLAEEKARGITIDLGFAHLFTPTVDLGFVDVPGHERFLHNALAGMGGIRAMLLVVAADEGVMPQTREHLAICGLLGIREGVVAITKTDRVDDERQARVMAEVKALLAPTPLASAPVLLTSAQTGRGVDTLRATLVAMCERLGAPLAADGPARLPIDRAFVMRGLGVVVTGTLAAGRVAVGDALAVLPGDRLLRVRGAQVHGRVREEAVAGERAALQLGGVESGELRRGMTLVTPQAFAPASTLCVSVTLLADAPPLEAPLTVRAHLFASESPGVLRPLGAARIAPGGSGLAELRLSEPLVAARGDRLILRRLTPESTLGGAVVLDPLWRRRRGGALGPVLARLAGSDDDALLGWVEERGESGASAAELAPRLGWESPRVESRLAALAAEHRLLAVPASGARSPRWLAPQAYLRVAERTRRALAEHFRGDRLSLGIPRAELVHRAVPATAASLGDVYLGWMKLQGFIEMAGDRVTLPGRAAPVSEEESALAQAVVRRFETGGLAPPSPSELQQALNAKPQILEGVVRYLVDRGRLVRLPGGLILAAAAVTRMREDLLTSGWERFNVAQFKDRFHLTRKWAIPLLEHLDSIGATRRMGEERQIVRPRA